MSSFLITGAGSGIGRAAAVELAKLSPSEMFLVGRTTKSLEETAGLLPKGVKATIVSASQSNQEELARALKPLKLETKDLQGVVANAGVGGENAYGPGDRWREIMDTNLSGTYFLVNECLPGLLASKAKARGVVLVASILARLGVPGYTAYCASKAGMLGLMRSWATQFAKKGVYFNAVCPGWVDTEMARSGIQQFADNAKRDFDDALSQQMAMVPTGKMSKPEEVGALIAFLLSGQQSSFTGQCFDINNGALMP